MTLLLALVFGIWGQSPAPPSAPPVDAKDSAAVKALYSAAAYEDVITLVSSLDVAAVTPEHEQYRALCFLALGHPQDAEASLERLVRQAPTFTVAEADVSPRFTTMFRDVRRRVLPGIVRERYAEGKRLYDERKFEEAVVVLKRVQAILNDPELSYPGDAFADLRQLADGFVRLADLEIAQAARAAAPPPPPAPVAVPAAPAPSAAPEVVVTKIVVYSSEHADVTPPVEIERFMPPWTPPAAMARAKQEYRGELEVIVDESGRVQQARMLRPTTPSYDLTLTNATRRWRFEPALRAGQPVKYLLTFQIVLAPAPQRR
jgi:protein TonB